jgi:hypothetical protein
VTSAQRRFALAVDEGTVTGAALLGRLASRWRLLAATTLAAGIGHDAIEDHLRDRVSVADPALATRMGLVPGAGSSPSRRARRLIRYAPDAPLLALVAASVRAARPTQAIVAAAGWRSVTTTPDVHDPRETTGLLLRPDVAAAVLAVGSPPAADERSIMDELVALLAAVRRRRPSLPLLLVGAAASRLDRLDPDGPEGGAPILAPDPVGRAAADMRTWLRGELASLDPGTPARAALERLAVEIATTLRLRVAVLALERAGASLVEAAPRPAADAVLERATYLASRTPGSDTRPPLGDPAWASILDERVLERFEQWQAAGLDRQRLADRALQLTVDPRWGSVGDGSAIQALAARETVARLVALDHDEDRAPHAPDLVVLVGDGFATMAPTEAFEIVVDALRRPGATQVALDHAGVLPAIASIDDPGDRRAMIVDLLGDLLLPLGTTVMVADLRSARGHDRVVGAADLDHPWAARAGIPLEGGTVVRLDLPPGTGGSLELNLRRGGRVGPRARRTRLPVTGGIAGLAIDLRGAAGGWRLGQP